MPHSNTDLLHELLAMKEVGIQVDDNVLNHARIDDISEYEGLSVSDLADLYCQLYNWTRPSNPGYKNATDAR
jgi:hypothetical protein